MKGIIARVLSPCEPTAGPLHSTMSTLNPDNGTGYSLHRISHVKICDLTALPYINDRLAFLANLLGDDICRKHLNCSKRFDKLQSTTTSPGVLILFTEAGKKLICVLGSTKTV